MFTFTILHLASCLFCLSTQHNAYALCVSLLLDLELAKAVTDRQTDIQTDKQRQNRLSVTITNLHMSMVHTMFTTFC